MIPLKSVYYFTCEDVEQLTGHRWNEFEFAQMAENGSYVSIYCDDGALEDLWEEYEYEVEFESEFTLDRFQDEDEYTWHKGHCKARRLSNQIELVEILRHTYGLRDEVLIWVAW